MLTFEALVRLSQHVAGTQCAVDRASVAKPFHVAERVVRGGAAVWGARCIETVPVLRLTGHDENTDVR